MTNTTEMNVTVSASADVKASKPTKKALFAALLTLIEETAPDNAETLTAFIKNEIALLEKRAASKTASKTQVENENIKAKILEALIAIDKPVTITELQTLAPELAIYTNQKMSALLTQMKADNLVTKTVEKKKSYFSAV